MAKSSMWFHIHFQKNFLKFLQSYFLKTKYAESRLPKLLIIITSSSFIILSRSGVFFCICILWFINTILKPNVLIFNSKVNIAYGLEYQASSNRIVLWNVWYFFHEDFALPRVTYGVAVSLSWKEPRHARLTQVHASSCSLCGILWTLL